MTLQIDDLRVAYGAHTVVSSLSVSTPHHGHIVGLAGANGAGKSSVLRAVAGIGPMTGRVTLGAEVLSDLSPRQRASTVAYMPQSLPQASSLTVYESVLSTVRIACPAWSAREAHACVAVVLEKLGIANLAMQALAELSGGQRQMAGLAQMLARKPKLMLLDEPTSALDVRWQLRLLQALRTHVEETQTLCILAVHDLNLAARFCDTLMLMRDGAVLARGTPLQVLTPANLQQAYGVQARVETCSQGRPIVLVDLALED